MPRAFASEPVVNRDQFVVTSDHDLERPLVVVMHRETTDDVVGDRHVSERPIRVAKQTESARWPRSPARLLRTMSFVAARMALLRRV